MDPRPPTEPNRATPVPDPAADPAGETVALPPAPAAPAPPDAPAETVRLTSADPPASAETPSPQTIAGPETDAGPESGPWQQRRRAAMAIGLGVIGLVLSVLIGFAAFGISRANHHRAEAADARGGASAHLNADADGCHWWAADPATKTNQKDVGAPPPSPVRRIGHRTMTITTNRGRIVIQVNASATPCTVASFTHLSVRHFYDNVPCHRLVTDGIYILQCGDPSGTGHGGPTYVFADELSRTSPMPRATGSDGLVTYPRGTVALANSGKNTNGSQFFMVYQDSPIPPTYTPFGTMSAGLDVLDQVARAGADAAYAPDPGGGHPKLPIVIQSLAVE